MKVLAQLALAALAAFPLSAHDAWRESRRVVVEAPRCAPYPRWEVRHHHDRWDDRWEHRSHYHRQDWDDRVFFRPLPRPLGPPFGGRLELHFR
jgi:hypothetical protein